MSRSSRIVYLAVVALLVVVGLGVMSTGGTAEESAAVRSILNESRDNEARAAGAPQQTVVNGWASRDLLAVQADRTQALIVQQRRTNQLLMLLLGAVLVLPVLVRRTDPSSAPATPQGYRPQVGGTVGPPAGQPPLRWPEEPPRSPVHGS